ncbi:MAG: PhnD/SsuA/transferrin family substrate-binding protein [Planctomycetes bacterium]|nr:PhnD/SsuA/transferrin family substrate-binding protein [Planctomycetota bacterium]
MRTERRTSKMRRRAAAVALLALGLAGAAAGRPPGERGLVVCYPHAPGSTELARPVMERLGGYLTWRAGFDLQPVYTNDPAEARRWIDEGRPRFAILSLSLFLQWREALDLRPVAQSERNHALTERYHLVVAQESPWRALEDLRAARDGRKAVIWSSHLDDPRFVSRVVLGGALEVTHDGAGDARGVVTAQPLRALRRMKANEPFEGQPVDAVLLEDAAWLELQRLQSFREGLRALHTSAPLPTPPVVSIGPVDGDDAARLREALVSMHTDERGRELLGTLQVTGFSAPAPEALEAAARAYGGAE